MSANTTYNYGDFILTKSNSDAASLCFSIAADMHKKSAVAFISGPSPCGKTHLLNTTADIYHKNYHEDALCISMTDMVDDYIKVIGTNNDKSFYDKYTAKGLLLIDDIQSVSNLSTVQKMLVNIISVLTAQGINIIMFSELGLKYYEELEKGLKNIRLFTAASIDKADFSLRKKILLKILQYENIGISNYVLYKLVFNKKIEITSFRGCVSKIKLMKELDSNPATSNEILSALKEYEK